EARTFMEGEAAAEKPPEPRAVKQKAAMLKELDELRQQRESLANNEVFNELRRRRDVGDRLMDYEASRLTAMEGQFARLGRTIFDLEGKIYETGSPPEAGSRMAEGTSDRPFRAADTGPAEGPPTQEQAQQRKFREDAEAKARAEQEAAINRLEAEWRERQR